MTPPTDKKLPFRKPVLRTVGPGALLEHDVQVVAKGRTWFRCRHAPHRNVPISVECVCRRERRASGVMTQGSGSHGSRLRAGRVTTGDRSGDGLDHRLARLGAGHDAGGCRSRRSDRPLGATVGPGGRAVWGLVSASLSLRMRLRALGFRVEVTRAERDLLPGSWRTHLQFAQDPLGRCMARGCWDKCRFSEWRWARRRRSAVVPRPGARRSGSAPGGPPAGAWRCCVLRRAG